ncbi:hypothetical protein [Candidatus Foliamicus sp.]
MLGTLRERLDEVHAALDFCACGTPEEAPDRQIFYRSPNLAMMRICFCPGLRTPPHDHATWAAILMLSGRERNTLYRRCSTHGLVRKGDVLLEAGSVFLMQANDIHVAECAADHPAVALHVYGGDLDLLPRSVWHPDTLEEFPMEMDRYEEFSRLASADGSAPGLVKPASLPA